MASHPPITLHLMDGEALIPRKVTSHLLSAGCVTKIVQKNEREAEILTEVDANERVEGLIVAKFRQDKWSVILESLAEGVTVEPPLHSHYSGAVEVPSNVCVFLRPSDTVRFGHRLTVAIAVEEDKDSLQRSAIDEVQVKSSNVEPEPVTSGEDVETDSSDDEEDLDRSSSAHSQRTPNEITPATSKPTEKVENVDTIKETPSRAAYTNSTGDAQPYSTAPGTLLDNHEETIDANSPSVQAQQRSNPESQVRAGDSLMNTFESTLSDQDEDINYEKPISLRKKQVTYGRQVRSKHDMTMTEMEQVSEVISSAESKDQSKSGDEKHEIDVEDTAPTSDALDLPGVMSETAIRTTRTGSQKRKLSDDDVKAEHDLIDVSKKQKIDGPSASPEMPVSAEDALELDDPSDEPRKSIQKPRNKKGRLPTAPRKSLRSLQPSPESGEEIAVMQKPSPEVVIKPSLMSDTPSSSVPSILTGKVPKLLLSSDCKAQNKSNVKQLLREAGAAIVKEVPSRRTHFVCVVTKQHSLKSAKVLLSLVRGKLIVDEDWLLKSAEAGELLDPAEFVHKTLEDSITHDRRRTFSGKHLFFTHDAFTNYKDGWSDIQEVAQEAGASEVDKVGFNRPSYLGDRDDVVFFGIAKADKDVARLVNDHGRTVYNKDLFTDSILAGVLNLTDESYKLSASTPMKKGRR